MGRRHRGLVGGGHPHAGANMARAYPPERRACTVWTDGYAIVDRRRHAGAGRRRHKPAAADRNRLADCPSATRNSARACLGRDAACRPPLAILATASTDKVVARQVMSGTTTRATTYQVKGNRKPPGAL